MAVPHSGLVGARYASVGAYDESLFSVFTQASFLCRPKQCVMSGMGHRISSVAWKFRKTSVI